MERKFVIALNEHRVVGFVFIPYIIELQGKSDYYSLVERITIDDIRKRPEEFTDEQKKLVKIIEEYSDAELVKNFTKKRTTNQEFISGLTTDMLERNIRPYIEKRLMSVIQILRHSDIELYYKDSPKQLYVSDRVSIETRPALAIFNFVRTSGDFRYFLTVKHGQHEMNLTQTPGMILVNEPCHLLIDNRLLFFTDIDGKKLGPFFKNEYVSVPKAREEEYLSKFVLNTIKKFRVNCSGFNVVEESPRLQKILSLEGDLLYLPVLKLDFDYGRNRVFYHSSVRESVVTLEKHGDDYVFYKTVRDEKSEDEAVEFLLSLGIEHQKNAWFSLPDDYSADPADYLPDLVNWLNIHSRELADAGFLIRQKFYEKKYFDQPIGLKTSFSKKDDWFDVYAVVEIGDFKIPFVKFRKHILQGNREYILPDGRVVILPKEWFAQYSDLFYFSKPEGDHFLFKKIHFQVLESSFAALDKNYAEAIAGLYDQQKPRTREILPEVHATLRPYQEEGFAWMWWLFSNHMGACLADDMGLGKTLQTLVLLKKVIGSYPSSFHGGNVLDGSGLSSHDIPATLIVLPASLVHNWFNEIQKFTPELNVLKYIGAGRSVDISDFGNYHIVLTTYGVVRNEFPELKAYPFLYIILDESQTIKNPESKIFQAVNELNAQYRLVLTGTPIENSLTDLWSQIDFINPGLLGDLGFFRQYFASPIEKEGNEERRDKLKKLIQPFILRRTKQEVATDLPPLTEQLHYCSMSEAQKSYYEAEKSKVRNEILTTIDQLGVEKSSMIVLNALIRLRQIANHPVMVDKDYENDSGKFEEISTSLENMYSENHKVLIFSSFVKHLELYRQFFVERGWKYAMLTGETKNREEVVASFQEDENNRFFLISLKAGGVGLNLTAADYVFLLDPWWNPAAEMQAINRAHRIGQTNKVFVYRFISAETVEEKIIKLQERKAELAETFINSNNPFKGLSKESILDLFD